MDSQNESMFLRISYTNPASLYNFLFVSLVFCASVDPGCCRVWTFWRGPGPLPLAGFDQKVAEIWNRFDFGGSRFAPSARLRVHALLLSRSLFLPSHQS